MTRVNKTKEASIPFLIEHLRYEDGTLFWNKKYCKRIKIGGRAGTYHSTGYTVIRFKGKSFLAHRVIWAMHGGFPIPDIIDHIDGNKTNNKTTNLRATTESNNQLNRYYHRKGKLPGTSYRKDKKKWEAFLSVDNKKRHLGYYESEKLAYKAALQSQEKI